VKEIMATTVPRVLSQTQLAVEVVATIAFALSGVIEGVRKRLGAVGICVVAGLAAFGGGTVHDLLLNRRPLFWVQRSGWVWVVLALCLGAMLFMRARHLEPTERSMKWPDALGLGLFTAVFGGVLRDIVCNEIPKAFSDHRPYAIRSIVGGDGARRGRRPARPLTRGPSIKALELAPDPGRPR
jgi:uncharacterized membrane protein YeiH